MAQTRVTPMTAQKSSVRNMTARTSAMAPRAAAQTGSRQSTVSMSASGINNSMGLKSGGFLGTAVERATTSINSGFNELMSATGNNQYAELAGTSMKMPVFNAAKANTRRTTAPSMMMSNNQFSITNNVSRTSSTRLNATSSPVVMAAGGDIDADYMDKEVAKMGINGFGRIGRLVFRSTFMDQRDKAKVLGINAPNKSLEYLKYLLEYDSVHGRFPGTVEIGDGGLIVDGQFVRVFDSRDPAELEWGAIGVDYVCDSTGAILTKDKAQGHLDGGAKKVVFAAPAKDDTATFVYGVNEEQYSSDMICVSNASCTTNCLAPISKIINDKFGIEEGLMTTVHATTASNATVDGTSAKDWRGGRANGPNIIPSSTGAAKAVGKVIPELNGKLTGMAFRVPTTNVSVVDLTVKLEKEATWDEICDAIKDASNGSMKGVVEFVDQPLVSQDFVSHPATSCFDAQASIQLSPKFVKLVAWYDNEWAYSNQLVKLTHFMAGKDGNLVKRADA